MSLWHAQAGPRRTSSAKFRSQSSLGTSLSNAGQHLGWHYDVIAHQTGSSVRRTSFNVAVSDAHRARVAYLRGFKSSELAATAAKELIEISQQRIFVARGGGEVGTIPPLPVAEQTADEQNATQEK